MYKVCLGHRTRSGYKNTISASFRKDRVSFRQDARSAITNSFLTFNTIVHRPKLVMWQWRFTCRPTSWECFQGLEETALNSLLLAYSCPVGPFGLKRKTFPVHFSRLCCHGNETAFLSFAGKSSTLTLILDFVISITRAETSQQLLFSCQVNRGILLHDAPSHVVFNSSFHNTCMKILPFAWHLFWSQSLSTTNVFRRLPITI